MGRVSWIKLDVDMPHNRKIEQIISSDKRNGYRYVFIWVQLLCLAGECNDGGLVYIARDKAYSNKELARSLGHEERILAKALQLFEELDMVCYSGGHLAIVDWENHQETGRLEEMKKKNRERQHKHREKTRKQPEVYRTLDDCF